MPSIKYKKKTYAGSSVPVLEMTKAQYDALPVAKQNDGTIYLITDDDGGWEAENSSYDNTDSGLSATNVQDALDELEDEKYEKPSGGIPKTDLASAVQTSLGKADTALQAHQDISIKEPLLSKGLGNSDIDILRLNGFYWMQKANSSGTQPGYDYYFLIVFQSGYSGITLQIAYNLASSAHKSRMFANGSWSTWA